MKEKSYPQRRELRIGIIDDDPCALEHEVGIVSRVQNRNGCHVNIWNTTKLDVGIHQCVYSLQRTDVVIIDISLVENAKETVLEEIKNAQPDIIIIGITAHIDRYVHTLVYLQHLHCIIDKATLNHELPSIVNAIYSEKTPRHRTGQAEPMRRTSAAHQVNRTVSVRGTPATYRASQETGRQRRQRNRKSHSPHHASAEGGSAGSPQGINGQKHDEATNNNKFHQVRYSLNPNTAVQRSNRDENGRNSERFAAEEKPDPTGLKNQCLMKHDLAKAQGTMVAHSSLNLKEIPLSPSELRVINLCSQGMETDEVAECLSISTNTVYSHRSHIMGKYHTHSWHEALTIYGERKHNGTA
ncbi:helix-turn-helix transcriptional regulator [Bifidobacterium sp. ESL0745]|uniref:response regulator transcription factor n=1 Tax=Bifidobacterium sp. ESL0745 TaxID=2983226 RepID=UPI0023F7CC07|nr:helix-turn-helix transcriptional regulator [Bifidobacterium sp. ESL0745]MDF7664564.1 helix-turn-helix transcriptional regulator [Bifidobacterium sp. ESL0745]